MKQQGNIVIILVIILATVVIGAGAYIAVKKPTPEPRQVFSSPSPILKQEQDKKTNDNEQIKNYQSKSLKFSIDVSSEFTIEEKFTSVHFKKDNQIILVTRSGTNFANINDHLKELQKRNNFTIHESQEIIIDNYNVVTGYVEEEKHYFIYIDYFVYHFSTKHEALYDDLDQIVQSFRYTP